MCEINIKYFSKHIHIVSEWLISYNLDSISVGNYIIIFLNK